ncbi:putative metallopeptidase [Patescibacteria group bacterium]
MEWQKAPKLQKEILSLVKKLNLTHIDPHKIIVFRSFGSKSRARARIWSFPRIWQQALDLGPHYCIEVLSEKFDHLSKNNRTRILIHELLHIPKTFSGSLLPHRGRGRVRVDAREVEKQFRKLK